MNVEETLATRQHTHGDFEVTAIISQGLCAQMCLGPNWEKLAPFQKESLEMIQHKIARILCGDSLFLDSVRDIIGYAKLMQDIVAKTEGATDVTNTKSILRDGKWEAVIHSL